MATSSGDPDDLARLADTMRSWADNLATTSAGHDRFIGGLLASSRQFSGLTIGLSDSVRSIAQALVAADLAARRQVLEARFQRVVRENQAWTTSATAKRKDLNRAAILAAAGGRLLTFDPKGDGRVVEVLGDLAAADHVAVVVPGMTNTMDNFQTDTRSKSAAVLDAMKRHARNGEKVAVVAWLGYNPPDINRSALSAPFSGKAADGAIALDADLDFIGQVNPKATVTVIGHSYGSVVVGQTMKRTMRASDAIVVGSPGMDANDRSELGSPTVRLWASKASPKNLRLVRLPKMLNPSSALFPIVLPVFYPKDPISFAPSHGEDPSAKGFHARRFSSKGVKAHGDYFRPGTESLENMAKIATGTGPIT